MPEINFYKTLSGKIPVEDFFNSLPGKHAQKIIWVLELFENTTFVSKQYFKKLINTDDIWEIRVIYSSNIFRVLGFFESQNVFVLTNGFVKKSQKTPTSEIKTAEQRKKEFMQRKKK